MKKIRVTRSVIPNLFTLMNLFGGFLAITRIAEGQHLQAAGFIVLAAVFDMLDGAVARLTKATSDFGVELDSLCDAVSFGVAPSFMLYQVYFSQLPQYGVVIASLPAMAGVLRLARFNVQTSASIDKRYFRGVPIPAGALTIISFVLYYYLTPDILPAEWKHVAIFAVTLLTSGVMVSTVKFDAMPFPSMRSLKERPLMMLFVTGTLFAGIWSNGVSVFPSMLLYIVAGCLRWVYTVIQTLTTNDTANSEQDDDEVDDLEL